MTHHCIPAEDGADGSLAETVERLGGGLRASSLAMSFLGD
jgi:hypothetical protein